MPLQAAVPLQYVFLRRTRDAGEGSPSNHGIAVDTGQSVGRPGRGARPPGRGARPPGRGARPARARSGAGSPAGFVPPRRDLIPHFAPRVWLFLEGAARPGPGSRCRGSRDGQGAARRCPGQSRRGPRFPCDGAAPAVPVVRRPGGRLWWIRALRWIGGIPVHRIRHEARIHHANPGQDAGNGRRAGQPGPQRPAGRQGASP
jgi:hypothetical protein